MFQNNIIQFPKYVGMSSNTVLPTIYNLTSQNKNDFPEDMLYINSDDEFDSLFGISSIQQTNWADKINSVISTNMSFNDRRYLIVPDFLSWDTYINTDRSRLKRIKAINEMEQIEHLHSPQILIDEPVVKDLQIKWHVIKEDINKNLIYGSRFFVSTKPLIDQHAKLVNQYTQNIYKKLAILSETHIDLNDDVPPRPNKLSIHNAKIVLDKMAHIICKNHADIMPYISNDEDGDVTVGWYSHNSNRELHLTILDSDVYYVKMCDNNIDWKQGSLSENKYSEIWDWLIYGQ